MMTFRLFVAGLLLPCPAAVAADWPTVAGDLERTGRADGSLAGPASVAWAVALGGGGPGEAAGAAERIGTAVEPIVADERVFVGTHAGRVWALRAETWEVVWTAAAAGPVLASAAYAGGAVVVADAGGTVRALDAATGAERWVARFPGDSIAPSPTIVGGVVLAGSRGGMVYALDLAGGKELWRRALGRSPIRQTFAVLGRRAYTAAEDLKLRCLDVGTGELLWTSRPMAGQSARDAYPVVTTVGGRPVVVVRTSPNIAMPARLSRDLRVLCAAAGIDASGWKLIDACTKDAARNRGMPERWERERQAVLAHMAAEPDARTFFALDADTGESLPDPPILWAGGCQGVGAPPAVLPDGRLLVEYRTAYGNWNHGVAPLVAVGILDLTKNAVEHVDHANGTANAPWNTYWGTADEQKHLQLVGGSALIVHQGTLCGFDLTTRRLTTLQGDRDTFGGLRQGLPTARNEWHGPARGGAAVAGDSLYWVSGSTVFRLVSGRKGEPVKERTMATARPVTTARPVADGRAVAVPPGGKMSDANRTLLADRLTEAVDELLSTACASLVVEPGIAGRDVAFAHSGEVLEALAWAYPHLPADRRAAVTRYVDALLREHPPLDERTRFDPAAGERREDVPPAAASHKRRGDDPPFDPFGNVAALAWWVARTPADATTTPAAQWQSVRASFEVFAKSRWSLDPAKGHLYANRYLGSLLACARLARANKEEAAAAAADAMAEKTASALAAWWKRAAAEQRAMAGIEGVAKLDQFIGGGGGVFFRLIPHRHKLALFRDLSPDVLAAIGRRDPESSRRAWAAFAAVAPTWYLVGEERQVHSGENLYDPPDYAMDAFRAARWVGGAAGDDLRRFADRPWGRADLYFIQKAAMALEGADVPGTPKAGGGRGDRP